MAWTTPRTWVTGEVVTASIMNTHVRDNLNSLKEASRAVIVRRTSALGLSNGTWNDLSWETEVWDDWAGWPYVLNANLIVPLAGRYLVSCSVSFSSGSGTGGAEIVLQRFNVSSVLQEDFGWASNEAVNRRLSAVGIADFAANDFVRVACFPSASGTAQSFTGRLSVTQVSAA